MLKKSKPYELPLKGWDVDDLDKSVLSRWHLKDPKVEIGGLTKDFLGEKEGFRVYQVDSEWIRNNLDAGFGTGGHGLVHSYIPMDEIWVDPMSENKWSLFLHEALEFKIMKEKGLQYKDAHEKVVELTKSMSIEDKKSAKIKDLMEK